MASRRKGKGTASKSSISNRLVGWLVSYEMDEMGKAYEIRAGRTLIGSERLNGNRSITVQEDTISAPHSAVHASRKHEVVVQDIFSEAGTYVKRADSPKEKPIAGPITLEHGDWLRIGEHIRLQLCLIEGASR